MEIMATAVEVDNTKRELSHVGGFAPLQWVLGKLLRAPGSQLDEYEAFDLGALANTAGDGADDVFTTS